MSERVCPVCLTLCVREWVSASTLLWQVLTMDAAGSGFLSREEFVQWYAKSEQRIQAQTRAVFDTVRDRAHARSEGVHGWSGNYLLVSKLGYLTTGQLQQLTHRHDVCFSCVRPLGASSTRTSRGKSTRWRSRPC
jgi:hypothetical protein